MRGRGDRAFGAGVFQELAEAAILALADRPVEADRMPADVHHPAGFLDADVGRPGGFFGRRLAAQLLLQPLGDVAQPREHVDHVDRDADRAGLIGDGPGDRLPNPPGGIGRKLVAAAIFELVDRPHQAGVPFLDQVQEAQAAVAILLGDRHDQPQVAAGKLPLDLFVIVELPIDQLDGGFAGCAGFRA